MGKYSKEVSEKKVEEAINIIRASGNHRIDYEGKRLNIGRLCSVESVKNGINWGYHAGVFYNFILMIKRRDPGIQFLPGRRGSNGVTGFFRVPAELENGEEAIRIRKIGGRLNRDEEHAREFWNWLRENYYFGEYYNLSESNKDVTSLRRAFVRFVYNENLIVRPEALAILFERDRTTVVKLRRDVDEGILSRLDELTYKNIRMCYAEYLEESEKMSNFDESEKS